MPSAPTLTARDRRILAGHRAGATILDLAMAEEVDPAVVRRVLRTAGISPGPLRKPSVDRATRCLEDHDWLRAEYATKSARQIAKELGCRHERVYGALHAAGVQMRENGHDPKAQQISPETAERVVSLYLAGSSAKRIADDLGLPVKDVTRLLEERGVKRTRSEVAALAQAERLKSEVMPRDEWLPEVRAEVLARYAAGSLAR